MAFNTTRLVGVRRDGSFIESRAVLPETENTKTGQGSVVYVRDFNEHLTLLRLRLK